VTIETLSGSPEQVSDDDTGRTAAPDPRPQTPEPAARRLWRGVTRRAVLVPLVVLAPLTALAPTADHRFNVYWHGGEIRHDPFELVRYSWVTIPLYFDNGNFRPLGRMVEGAVDLASFLLMDFLSLPANISLRLVSFLSAAVLTVVAVLFAESMVARGRLFTQAPSRISAAVPFAVGAGFVAAGATSTTVLFGGLYWLSSALILGVAAVLCRAVTTTGRNRVGWRRGAYAVLVGAALAMFNEMAYLALPLAVVAVFVRGRWVLGLSARQVLSSAGARLTGLVWLGFLPVFLPVRVMIYLHCSDGGCYRGSDIAPSADMLVAWPNRMLSWLPPLMWGTATKGTEGQWLGVLALVALLVLAVLAWQSVVDLPRLAPVDRRQALGVAGAALAVLVLGSALAALNAEVQAKAVQGRWGEGWRDSAVTGVGGPLLVVGLFFAVLTVGARMQKAQRWATGSLVVVLAITAAVSAAANKAYFDDTGRGRSAILNNAVAHEIADFDRTSAGNERRCGLREQFRETYQNGISTSKDTAEYPGARSPLGRFDATVDTATKELFGVRFCRGGKP
jgi:hypothetical protein